jgi:hypothetical protein
MKNYYQNQVLTNSGSFAERNALIEQGKKDGTFYPPKVGDIIAASFINGFAVIIEMSHETVAVRQYRKLTDEAYVLWGDTGRPIDRFYDDALLGIVQKFEPQDITPAIKKIALRLKAY